MFKVLNERVRTDKKNGCAWSGCNVCLSGRRESNLCVCVCMCLYVFLCLFTPSFCVCPLHKILKATAPHKHTSKGQNKIHSYRTKQKYHCTASKKCCHSPKRNTEKDKRNKEIKRPELVCVLQRDQK